MEHALSDEGRRMPVLDAARAVWSRRWGLAASVFGAVLSASAGLVAGLPDVYRATATILVEHGGATGPAMGEVEAQIHRIQQGALSRSRLNDLIERFGLYANQRAHSSEEAVLERMRRDIRIELNAPEEPQGRGATTAFTAGYRGTDPGTASLVTNALASSFVEEDREIRGATARRLGSQMEEVKTRLVAQEGRLREFRSLHPGELPQQLQATLAASSRVDAQLRATSEARMRAMEERAGLLKQLAESGADDEPDTTAARLGKLRQELSELRRRFTDRHPDVRRVKAEVAALEAQGPGRSRPEPEAATPSDASVVAGRRSLRDLDAQIRGLKAEEQRLRGEAAIYLRRLENAGRSGPEVEELTRDYETTKALYETLLRRHQEARLAANAGQRDAGTQGLRILEPAVPPTDPVAPQRLRLLLFGLALALGAALGAVVLAEQADGSFHSMDDVRAFTRVPVLASIPRIVSPRVAGRRLRRRLVAAVSALAALVLIAAGSYHVARGNDQLVSTLSRGRS